MPKSIYLDYAASATPNPGSIHESGLLAKKKLERARKDVAEILRARPQEIIFTSGGTEGNNLAIQGLILALQAQKNFGFSAPAPHIVITNIEHPSVFETCRLLEQRGLAAVSVVPVEQNGIVNPKKVRAAIRPNTVLVSVMLANNEIGTIQPLQEIAREIRHYKKSKSYNLKAISYPIFHTDAVQAVNYLDLNALKLGVDMLTLSGSKIPGAGRVGLLYKKKSIQLAPIFGGGDQEHGLRPGTENLEAIVKFSSALAKAQKIRDKESQRLLGLRDYFLEKLSRTPLDIVINGDLKDRLPNNINITFPNIPSDLLVIELSAKGVMCSSKSACKSSRSEGSYVIRAIRKEIGLPAEAKASEGGVRFSLGADTTKRDIDYTVKTLTHILQKLEKWYTS